MWVWNLRHVELVVRVRYKVQVCTIAGVERMYLSHETSVCLRKEKALREREAWKEKVGWLQAGPGQGEVIDESGRGYASFLAGRRACASKTESKSRQRQR